MHKLFQLVISSLQKMQEYTAMLICGTNAEQVAKQVAKPVPVTVQVAVTVQAAVQAAREFFQPQAMVQKPVYVVTDSLTQDNYGARPR
ncbi:MAG: hypothetical protein LCH63_10935 [Candidatus Melainabacteria bacterium]|nr:hypothetical protein [Candidatus Melainabacteria bacterium]